MVDRQRVGSVSTFFAKVGVAGIEVTEGRIKVGDTIAIEGASTRLEQLVESMQVDRKDVPEAGPGAKVGIKTKDRVRPGDAVYVVTPGHGSSGCPCCG